MRRLQHRDVAVIDLHHANRRHPTTTELFAGRVDANGSTFYSFTVVENGTVNATLAEVGGANVPSTVWLGLGLGTPSGEDCSTTPAVNTACRHERCT